MKATKKNLKKYLEASIKNLHAVANLWKENNNEEEASRCIREASALRDILYCLTNDGYFTIQYKNMVKED